MIKIKNVQKYYKLGEITVKALDGVTVSIEEGEVVSLMGKSGSGKSTLLHQIGLLDYPTAGKIIIDGKDVININPKERGKMRLSYLGYIFQEYAILHELTALENVMLPAIMLGNSNPNPKSRAIDLLSKVGLKDRMDHLPKELSGGEQQRVAIARALINQPDYIFADEPTANLDSKSSQEIMETLVDMNKKMEVTVIFVSHDPDDKKIC